MSQDQHDHQADAQAARETARLAETHHSTREDSTRPVPETDVFAAMDDYMNSTDEPESDHDSIHGAIPASSRPTASRWVTRRRSAPAACSIGIRAFSVPAAMCVNTGSATRRIIVTQNARSSAAC